MASSSSAIASYFAFSRRNCFRCGSTISIGSSTFSRVERHGSRVAFWNAMPTILSGWSTTWPATDTRPLLARISPATTLSRVDLPQPLGPTSEMKSPRSMVRLAPCSASVPASSSSPALLR